MKTWQRRLGLGVAGLAGLTVLVIGGAYGMSASAVGPQPAADAHPFDASSGNVPEGARLGEMYGCTECHTPDLGGTVMIDGMPFVRLAAPNLTAGAPDGALTDEEFERALRHGIGRDGRKLFVMPSSEYTYLSDQDVANILAWIRTLPAVERDLPARTFGPVGRAMVALGRVPFQSDIIAADPNPTHLERPAADDPVRLGHYYTRLCIGCHGAELAGAPPLQAGMPPGANLTPAGNLRNWSFEQFRTVFETGRTPEGKQLDPMVMPWQVFGKAQPHELEAIWAYLQTIPPRQSPVIN
jgi:mono/diheme cytochrome c family protein